MEPLIINGISSQVRQFIFLVRGFGIRRHMIKCIEISNLVGSCRKMRRWLRRLKICSQREPRVECNWFPGIGLWTASRMGRGDKKRTE